MALGSAAPRRDRASVLVVNDDGIDAPGILALVRALANCGTFDVYVAAPDAERSACSHCISIHAPLAVEPRSIPGAIAAYAVSGTPADCAMLATGALFPSIRFDFVVSGVNRGDNLGRHVIYSGTVAGAREGAMKTGGVGVAVSLCSYSRDADYSDAASVAAETLTAVRSTLGVYGALAGKVLNVNVPHRGDGNSGGGSGIKGVKLTRPGFSCTQPDWVRVSSPGEDAEVAAAAPAPPKSDDAYGAGVVPSVVVGNDETHENGALVADTGGDAAWTKGVRWFRNRPGPHARDDGDGTDQRAIDDGYVSVSILSCEFEISDGGFEGGRESAWATGSDAGEVLRGYRDARCIGGGA